MQVTTAQNVEVIFENFQELKASNGRKKFKFK
jgi:hypothetical protein